MQLEYRCGNWLADTSRPKSRSKTGNVKPSLGHASPGQPCRTLCIVCRRPKPSPSGHLGTHDSSHRRNTWLIQPIHLPDSYANTAVNSQNSTDKISLAQSKPPTSTLQTIVVPLWTIISFRINLNNLFQFILGFNTRNPA